MKKKRRNKSDNSRTTKQEAIENSYNYFGVDFIDGNVSNTREAQFYNKIKTDTEEVIDAVEVYDTRSVKT